MFPNKLPQIKEMIFKNPHIAHSLNSKELRESKKSRILTAFNAHNLIKEREACIQKLMPI